MAARGRLLGKLARGSHLFHRIRLKAARQTSNVDGANNAADCAPWCGARQPPRRSAPAHKQKPTPPPPGCQQPTQPDDPETSAGPPRCGFGGGPAQMGRCPKPRSGAAFAAIRIQPRRPGSGRPRRPLQDVSGRLGAPVRACLAVRNLFLIQELDQVGARDVQDIRGLVSSASCGTSTRPCPSAMVLRASAGSETAGTRSSTASFSYLNFQGYFFL